MSSNKPLHHLLVARQLVASRRQAESWIRLGKVYVNGQMIIAPDYIAPAEAHIELRTDEQYVSRAGLKLASVAQTLRLDFHGAVVLDVGSSTGGFTDYALQHGARKVVAVDKGRNQLHGRLREDPRVELHEQTDIRDMPDLTARPDIILIDVSFISLREVLPHIARHASSQTRIIAMCKPQFEAAASRKHKGIIKNEALRREILKAFEAWLKGYFVIHQKADSDVAGSKGNRERFYALTILSK